MNRQRLNRSFSSIALVQKELARVERGLGTAKLALPRTKEAVRTFENQVANLRSDLEALIMERLMMRQEAIKIPLTVQPTPVARRERLSELIDDIRYYRRNTELSPQFIAETERMLSEAILKRADLARELGIKVKGKCLDSEWRWILDDMMEARLASTKDDFSRNLKVVAHALTDVLQDLGMLRTDVNNGKVREILWTIMKGIIGAVAGSGLLALYRLLSIQNVTAQARAAGQMYEEAWSTNKELIEQASSLFTERIESRDIFDLLFRVSRPL